MTAPPSGGNFVFNQSSKLRNDSSLPNGGKNHVSSENVSRSSVSASVIALRYASEPRLWVRAGLLLAVSNGGGATSSRIGP